MQKQKLTKDPRQPSRKLELRHEKIRELAADDLERVRGGIVCVSYRGCTTISNDV